MSDTSNYRLKDAFLVDRGELKNSTKAESFTLGVEWSLFRAKLLASNDPFTMVIHDKNAERLAYLARNYNRAVTFKNTAVGWGEITVTPNTEAQVIRLTLR